MTRWQRGRRGGGGRPYDRNQAPSQREETPQTRNQAPSQRGSQQEASQTRNPAPSQRGGQQEAPQTRNQAPSQRGGQQDAPQTRQIPTKAEVKAIPDVETKSNVSNPAVKKQNSGSIPSKPNVGSSSQMPVKVEPKSPVTKVEPKLQVSPAAQKPVTKTPQPKVVAKTETKTEPLKEPNQNIQKQDAQIKPTPNRSTQKENENANGEPESMDTSTSDQAGEKSLKRPYPKGKEGSAKKRKREHGPSQPKNALVQLNELKKGLVYIVESQEGPPHNPTFVVYVEVNGEKFYGKGRSKQEGKHAAAQAALASFLQFPKMPEAVFAMQKSVVSCDFTSDSIEEEKSIFQLFTAGGESPTGGKLGYEENTPLSQKRVRKALSASENKNPIMVLNELHPGLQYNQVGENLSTPTQRFVMSVQIGDDVFEGTGQSKKLAKAAAARAAISSLYGYSLCSLSGNSDMPMTPINRLPQIVADKIGQAVFRKFSEVMGNDEEHQKWKVLAGIVMTVGTEMQNITVISVSSGTKCIGGEHMSMNGASLSDCHAEIISQRCLKDFLYKQLEMCIDGDGEQSILQRKPNRQFTLKPGVRFHLFISTAPCGDARIFSPNELLSDAIDRHPMRKARGLLRSKIEAGEGTIPIKPTDRILTWDGIIQGQQRLLTMSCSDKILRWNVLGVQGCLLNYFIEPIYLESIILGSLLHPGHMGRAMYGRIENELGNLPERYRLNKPSLNIVSSTESRQLNKSPTFSVNWSIGMTGPEIVNGTTGKLQNGQVSRIAKRSFLSRFAALYKKQMPGLKHNQLERKPHMYSDIKSRNTDYQRVKEAITQAMYDANLGMWVKKPVELNEFEVEFY